MAKHFGETSLVVVVTVAGCSTGAGTADADLAVKFAVKRAGRGGTQPYMMPCRWLQRLLGWHAWPCTALGRACAAAPS